MRIIAKPIDMIASFCIEKKPMPRKFRFFEDSGEKVEVVVERILCVEESRIAGIDDFLYTCQSRIFDEEKIYQIKYIIGKYSWQLYKV